MKEKISNKREQQGITLVALVVTIVVLLILAGVSIVTLFGESGIITAAQKAAEQTKDSVNKDLAGLKDLEKDLDKQLDGGWTQEKDEAGNTIFIKGEGKEKVTVRIGDYVEYNCASGEGENKSYISYSYRNKNSEKNKGRANGSNYDQTFTTNSYTNAGGKWRVLGIDDNGHLEIVASREVTLMYSPNAIKITNFMLEPGGTGVGYADGGKAAFKYGVEELNEISKIYGYGKGANGARSINVEDVNKVTGYNPKNPANGIVDKYGKDKVYEYGNEVTYTWSGDVAPEYKGTNETTGILSRSHNSTGFTWYDESIKDWKNSEYKTSKSPITTIVSSSYEYNYDTFITSSGGSIPVVGQIKFGSQEYNTIFNNDTGGTAKYWLATQRVTCSEYGCYFGFFVVNMNSLLMDQDVFASYGSGITTQNSNHKYGVRPVVSLASDIELIPGSPLDDGTLTWSIK